MKIEYSPNELFPGNVIEWEAKLSFGWTSLPETSWPKNATEAAWFLSGGILLRYEIADDPQNAF